MDLGVDTNHPHFALHGNVDPASPLHADFTDTRNVLKGGNAAFIVLGMAHTWRMESGCVRRPICA
jgi:hypothetical protein